MSVTGGEAEAGVEDTDGTRGAGVGGNEGAFFCLFCQENENDLHDLDHHFCIKEREAPL